MDAFEALAKLDSSNVMEVRGTITMAGCMPRIETLIKSRIAKYGLYITPAFLAPTATWEVAYVCENCSGNGIIMVKEFHNHIGNQILQITNEICPECKGDKMIWSDK